MASFALKRGGVLIPSLEVDLGFKEKGLLLSSFPPYWDRGGGLDGPVKMKALLWEACCWNKLLQKPGILFLFKKILYRERSPQGKTHPVNCKRIYIIMQMACIFFEFANLGQ